MMMLDSLKQAGKNIGHEISRGWENLSDGWREMLSHSSNALTHFSRDAEIKSDENSGIAGFPRWSLLAGEVEETGKEVLVRVEIPGMEKEDCSITIEDNVLSLHGEKRFERESHDSTYHVMERAYGSFQRSIPLPRSVDIDKAEAHYKNGVLTVRLPKTGDEKKSRFVAVS
jgi:HSP20 family protein